MSSFEPYWGWFAAIVLAGAICSANGAATSKAELLGNLQHGGYVIVMRHASSPREAPDSASANQDNPKSERQLDELGIESARALGQALHRLAIPIGQVLCSPTYRALQTVKLAELGQAITFAELGDGDHSMETDPSGTRGAWLVARAAQIPLAHTNTLIVTHYPNIMEAFGQRAAGLADGEALILKPEGNGGSHLVTRLKIDDWGNLDRMR